MRRIPIGYQDENLVPFGPFQQMLSYIPKRSAVPIGSTGLNVCQTVAVKIGKDVVFHIGLQVNQVAGCAVAIHHHRNMQTITKILEDDGGRLRVFVSVFAAHAAAFVQQHCDRHIKALLGRHIFGKYLLVRAV